MHRRHFLTACLAASSCASYAWSAPATDQRLLIVFLRGGYDAINIVIPTSSDFYYEARPTIALARPDPANANAALPLDSDWSLHPALKESIYPLWKKGQVAFVPFAGTDDISRSHFETQDTIELGQSADGPRNYRSGFMGRLAQQLSGARPIAFTTLPPLAFNGALPVPNLAVTSIARPGINDRQAQLIEAMYRGTDLDASVAEGFLVRNKVFKSTEDEMAAASRAAGSAGGFELAARRIARLMNTEYNLGFIDVGGWDTHVNQGGSSGLLANRVGQLGRGIAALSEQMGPDLWAKTTVVVISEFGRTFRENGDKGTDHGHGSVYWVVGGSVNGGRLAGDQVKLEHRSLNEDRDLKVLTDYRSMLGELVSNLFDLSPSSLAAVFPGAAPSHLKIV